MKKKIFFLLSSLKSGGSERVFWLLSQYMDTSKYEISLVLFDMRTPFFSTAIPNVRIINLDTIRASRSFFKLYQLIRRERPYAIFTTGGEVNMLMSFIAVFIKVPRLIARQTNIPDERRNFSEKKRGAFQKIQKIIFRKFNFYGFDMVVCQSDEMKISVLNSYKLETSKSIVIPNPVVSRPTINKEPASREKKVIIVARLISLKGHARLLEVFKELPDNYTLTIAGDGPLKGELQSLIKKLKLDNRVEMVGSVRNIEELIFKHGLLVLSSFTEGFPNVILEALSVGVPVVTFRVGGVSNVIIDGFNGFIAEQGDLQEFKKLIMQACNKDWNHEAIKTDIDQRFSIENIAASYQSLI